MPRAATIPGPTDLLCEHCGYPLTGLDVTSRCPECGRFISESSPSLRFGSPWEVKPSLSTFVRTALVALFAPRRFFRGLTLLGDRRRSRQFGRLVRAVVAVILGIAAWLHADRFGYLSGPLDVPGGSVAALSVLVVITFALASWATSLVVRLTAFEGAYRGLRLPRDVVSRMMDYHAVQLLPPALFGVVMTGAYAWVDRHDSMLAATWVMPYLYTLAGGVVVSATFAFMTYWTAMRGVMYGNAEVSQIGNRVAKDSDFPKVSGVEESSS